MNPSNCKHESPQRRNAAASLPPRYGDSFPFESRQGGIHSLSPSAPYPFPLSRFLIPIPFVHLKKGW